MASAATAFRSELKLPQQQKEIAGMAASLFHGAAWFEMRVVESHGQVRTCLPRQDGAFLLPNIAVAGSLYNFLYSRKGLRIIELLNL